MRSEALWTVSGDRTTPEQREAMRDLATDGQEKEWGWYEDHVPVLLNEIERLERERG